jgi:hypothetical protein
LGGIALFLAAAMGWTAAATKNEVLAFGFGYLSLVVFLIFTALGVTVFIENSDVTRQLTEGCALQSGMIYELD